MRWGLPSRPIAWEREPPENTVKSLGDGIESLQSRPLKIDSSVKSSSEIAERYSREIEEHKEKLCKS